MTPLILTYDLTAVDSNYSLTLPISNNSGSRICVNWGDATIDTNKFTHIYKSPSVYIVHVYIISGAITELNQKYDTSNSQKYLISCSNFGEIGLINLSYAFYNCSCLNVIPISLPKTSNIIDTSYMFYGASAFSQDISNWNVSKVTNMSYMFYGAAAFNEDISNWNVSNVTNMSYMFYGAAAFNADIGGWNVSNVYDMDYMFYNARSFNQDVSCWNIFNVEKKSDIFVGASNFNEELNSPFYEAINEAINEETNYPLYEETNEDTNEYQPNYNRSYSMLSESIDTTGFTGQRIPCFKQDTKILTDKGYKFIQHLRKGDLVKTYKHNYKAIHMIGKKDINHCALQERIKYQLYVCRQKEYPEVFEDLIITGCHSVLVNDFVNEEQRNKTIEINGQIYITDDKYRLPVCADLCASVYETPGTYTIYHLALENDDYYMNYGIYANGLLVETCSKRYLKELSNMTLIE
jgi:surface protein